MSQITYNLYMTNNVNKIFVYCLLTNGSVIVIEYIQPLIINLLNCKSILLCHIYSILVKSLFIGQHKSLRGRDSKL